MSRKLTGIRRRRQAWEVNVRVNGHLYTDTFPLATPAQEMKDWRQEHVEKFGGERTTGGSFGADIDTYLSRVTAMPTYKQRAAHLALWAKELGRDRPRRTITAEEIDVVLNGWLETPTAPAPGQKGRPIGPDGLSPGTVRKRRTALQSFFAKMNGKKSSRANPVKGSENPKPRKDEARGLDYLTIERAIAEMPEHRAGKPGTVKRVSLSKIRTRVIAYTGIPPGLLKTVRATDLQLTAATIRIVPRNKGGGVEARTLPLTPEGLAAFKDFHAANAYGSFATQSLNRAFQRACGRAGLDPATVHLYDLRHSFLSQLYRVTRDLATVGRLGLHGEGSPMTARYAKGANQTVDAAATVAFSAALAEQRRLSLKAAPVPPAAEQLAATVGRSPMSRTRRQFRDAS